MHRPRTVIAHEHRLFLGGLELLLAEQFDIVFTTAESAVLDAVHQFHPELLVYGLHKHAQAGLEVIGEIHESNPDTAVAVISRFDDPKVASEALQRGAHAYILTTSSETELLEG